MIAGSSRAKIFAILIFMALPPSMGSTMDGAGIIVGEFATLLWIHVGTLVSGIIILLVFVTFALVERDLLVLLI